MEREVEWGEGAGLVLDRKEPKMVLKVTSTLGTLRRYECKFVLRQVSEA